MNAARGEVFFVSIRVRAAMGSAARCISPFRFASARRPGPHGDRIPRAQIQSPAGWRASDRIRFQTRDLADGCAVHRGRFSHFNSRPRGDGTRGEVHFPVSIRVRAATGPARGSNPPCSDTKPFGLARIGQDSFSDTRHREWVCRASRRIFPFRFAFARRWNPRRGGFPRFNSRSHGDGTRTGINPPVLRYKALRAGTHRAGFVFRHAISRMGVPRIEKDFPVLIRVRAAMGPARG